MFEGNDKVGTIACCEGHGLEAVAKHAHIVAEPILTPTATRAPDYNTPF